MAIIGSSNTDLVIKTERIPEPGETILGGEFMMTPGGKGANQAVAAARLGGKVAFITMIGDDIFGKEALDHYKEESMDISCVFTDPETPSGAAIICVDAHGENCIVVSPGANNKMTRKDIDMAIDVIESSDIILMQLETPMDVIEYVADIAWEKGKKVVLNPAPAVELSADLIKKLYLITPNSTECKQITGIAINSPADASTAADALLEMGAGNVVITLGSNGAYVKNHQMEEFIPAILVEAVDTTAAGDTFNGALCVGLSEGMSLSEAVHFATKAAAISVTRMGAQASIPYRREIS
ncbi:MAG TPA: ribokinase [Bacteroidales bacterium]|nr:ribokinase [Bacteroidales bacterium]